MTDPSGVDGPEQKLQPGRTNRGTSFADFPSRLASLAGQDCVKLGVVSADGAGSATGLQEVALWASGGTGERCVEPRIAAAERQSAREAERAARETRLRTELERLASATDTIFPNTYAGLVLRAITVGKFELVPELTRALFDRQLDMTTELFGVNRNDPFVKIIEGIAELSSADRRDSPVFVAYALGRAAVIGSCGDVMTTYTQEKYYWEEYVNGLGQVVGSSGKERVLYTAEVPSKFDKIVRYQNDIESPFLIASQVGPILERLTCDSPARQQLEDNLIAFFDGSGPVHIGPVPSR